ncbi:MAG TPA: aminotransferase class I/II-fold pyridoxal phosphate-dependent enzyme [Bacteroidales bacterium]|nr:aminotransferase class I/II-fold pyridoxal phosphate-dependent enzyme [Bacteroidales bacterium]
MESKHIRKIYLDRNENQYGPAPSCYSVFWSRGDGIFNCYSRDFSRGVKSALSERLAKDYGTDEKNILVGYGSEDILKQAVQCFLERGDKIMIPSHSWWYYQKIAEEAEGTNIIYPIVEDGDSFRYDIEGMISLYREHKPKLVLVSSPNNPTGNRLSVEELHHILDNINESVVILDEAYSQFDPDYNLNPGDLTKKYPHVIIIRTFSKYYALAGIRTGYAVIGNNNSRMTLVNNRYLGFNRLSERIAIKALDSPRYYSRIRKQMNSDMNMYFTELNKLPGFKAYRSYANFILVKIPPEIKEPLDAYLKKKNFVIKFMNEEVLNSHARITIGTRFQNYRLVSLIKSFMRTYKKA